MYTRYGTHETQDTGGGVGTRETRTAAAGGGRARREATRERSKREEPDENLLCGDKIRHDYSTMNRRNARQRGTNRTARGAGEGSARTVLP